MSAYVLYRVTIDENQDPRIVYTAIGRLNNITEAKASNSYHIPILGPDLQTFICLFEPSDLHDDKPLISDYRNP